MSMQVLLYNLSAIGCVVGAVLHQGRPGWGWFLVCALLLHTTIRTKDKADE